MKEPLSMTLDSSLAELDVLHDEFRRYAEERDLPQKVRHAFHLALEELVTNIITHGYHSQPGRPINIEIRCAGEDVVARVEDRSPPFNPLEFNEPDLSIPPEQRPIGGLGFSSPVK